MAANSRGKTIVVKRPYCSDYKPFSSVFAFKALGLQAAKASLLSFSLLLLEYNKHLDQQIAAQQKGKYYPDFDWKAAFDKHFPKFKSSFIRFQATPIITKFYQMLSHDYLSLRITDKLSKDVMLSLKRKAARYSPFQASARIFKTTFFSSSLMYLASFTYDIIDSIYHVLHDKKRIASAKEMAIWTGKRAVYYFICLSATSLGTAIGSYINQKNGGLIGALIFESITSNIGMALLQL